MADAIYITGSDEHIAMLSSAAIINNLKYDFNDLV
jgi:hypothetical protein